MTDGIEVHTLVRQRYSSARREDVEGRLDEAGVVTNWSLRKPLQRIEQGVLLGDIEWTSYHWQGEPSIEHVVLVVDDVPVACSDGHHPGEYPDTGVDRAMADYPTAVQRWCGPSTCPAPKGGCPARDGFR